MKKGKPLLFPVLGICLIVISVAMVLVFQIQMEMGTWQSRQILQKLEQLLPERTVGVPGADPNAAMPVLEMDGVDYAAVLEVPAFGITLPVADRWDSGNLSASPARFFGSTQDSPLVIGGADDSRQFGFCDKIEHGAIVSVTDMTGAQFSYSVSRIDRAKHAQAQWLMKEGYDLTLFCHDVYSMEYIAVRCIFAYR